jgi:hypothetical protein
VAASGVLVVINPPWAELAFAEFATLAFAAFPVFAVSVPPPHAVERAAAAAKHKAVK